MCVCVCVCVFSSLSGCPDFRYCKHQKISPEPNFKLADLCPVGIMSIFKGRVDRGDSMRHDWPFDRACFVKAPFPRWAWADVCSCRPLWKHRSTASAVTLHRQRPRLSLNGSLGRSESNTLEQRDRLNPGIWQALFVDLFFRLGGFRTSPNVFCQGFAYWCLLRAMPSVHFWFIYPRMIKTLYFGNVWHPEEFFWIFKYPFCFLMRLQKSVIPVITKRPNLPPASWTPRSFGHEYFLGCFCYSTILGCVSYLLYINLFSKAVFEWVFQQSLTFFFFLMKLLKSFLRTGKSLCHKEWTLA